MLGGRKGTVDETMQKAALVIVQVVIFILRKIMYFLCHIWVDVIQPCERTRIPLNFHLLKLSER